MITTIPRHLPREMLSLACDLEGLLTSIRKELDRDSSILHRYAHEVGAVCSSVEDAMNSMDRLAWLLHLSFRRLGGHHREEVRA